MTTSTITLRPIASLARDLDTDLAALPETIIVHEDGSLTLTFPGEDDMMGPRSVVKAARIMRASVRELLGDRFSVDAVRALQSEALAAGDGELALACAQAAKSDSAAEIVAQALLDALLA